MGAKRLAKTQSPKRRFPIVSKVTTKQRRQTPIKNNYKKKDCGQILRPETAMPSCIRKKSNLNFRTGNNIVNNGITNCVFDIFTTLNLNRLVFFQLQSKAYQTAPALRCN